MMFIGLLLFFGGIGVAAYRSWRAVAYERFIGGIITVVLLLAGADLDGLVLLVLVDLLILLVLVTGNVRIAKFREAHVVVAAGE